MPLALTEQPSTPLRLETPTYGPHSPASGSGPETKRRQPGLPPVPWQSAVSAPGQRSAG